MSVLPPKGDAVLIIDPDAMTARLVTLQTLQTVTGRNRQIVKARSGVEQLELPLNAAPHLTRDSSSGARISVAKQVSSCVVSECLNHDAITYYTCSM
jgi:hypothetical protein